jgi:cell division protein FtsI/penicillin-binding protein 2
VNETIGTANDVRSERVRVAGKKTGHGRSATGSMFERPVAGWFAGYAPADDPRIAIVVEIDGSPHDQPACVAIDVLAQYLAPSD